MVKECKVEIDRQLCKGCGLCIMVCHPGVLRFEEGINGAGYHPAMAGDLTKCSACARCAQMCPDIAITLEGVEIDEGIYEGKRGVM